MSINQILPQSAKRRRPDSFFRLTCFVCCAASIFTVLLLIVQIDGTHRAFGNFDFIQYWSAFRLFAAGQNPFDPALMLELQSSSGMHQDQPVMMWNPPWLLLLLSPVLRFDLKIAAQLWALANLLLALLSAGIVWYEFSGKKTSAIFYLAAACTFFPVLYAIRSGQLGPLLLFASALMLRGLRRNEPIATGIGIFLALLKPHVFYLVFIFIVFGALRKRELRGPLFGLGLLAAAMLSLMLFEPAAMSNWIGALKNRDAGGYASIYSWDVPTLVGVSRRLLADSYGRLPLYPAILIPAAAALMFAFYWLRRPKDFEWDELFPTVLLLSYLSSPYGWIGDQSILCLVLFSGLESSLRTSEARAMRFMTLAFALQISALLSAALGILQSEHQFFWFPLALGLLFLGARRTKP